MNNELFKQRRGLMDIFVEYFSNEKKKVVLFNGEWGSGKSFFVDKFIDEINSEDIIPIKFDCWEHQGDDDINNILLETIYEKLKDSVYNGSKYENIKHYMINNKVDVVKGLGKFFIKLLPISDAIQVLSDIIQNATEGINTQELYQLYNNVKFNNFIQENEFYDITFKLMFENGDKKKKYILIFDELDRCDPDYAIRLIKKIVYLNKELKKKEYNINILLVMNKTEFSSILKHYYGEEYSVDQYYDKMFDYEFNINNGKNSLEYIEDICLNFDYNMELKQVLKYEKIPDKVAGLLENNKNYRQLDNYAYEIMKNYPNPNFLYDRNNEGVFHLMIKCYKTMAYDIYIELKNSAEYLNSSIYVDDYDIYINKDSERCVECLEIINRYCLLKKLDAKYLLKSDNTQITDENKTKIKDNMNKVVAHLINNISLYFN